MQHSSVRRFAPALLAAVLLMPSVAAQPLADGSPAAAAALSRALRQLTPVQQAKLAASDAAASDAFGFSVSISGDRALVGAYLDDHSSLTDAGSAYVFVRTGTTWTQEAKLIADVPAAASAFGFSVSLSGDRALVGAFGSSLPGAGGAAYVFARTGSTWTQEARLVALDAAAGDQFGHAVALRGDRALVGAYLDDDNGLADSGSAYVFVYGNGMWRQEAKFTAGPDADASAHFGRSVALSADRAVVGAPLDAHGGLSAAGAAFVFSRALGLWTQEATLTAASAAANQQVGYAVAVTDAGDRIAVGAPGGTGSAVVFARTGTAWNQEALVTGGSIVAIGDSRLLAGNLGSNLVPLYERTGTTWASGGVLLGTDTLPPDTFGRSVSLSGDDALVGAPMHDGGGLADSGAAYVFTGVGPVAAEPEAVTGVALSLATPNPASGWATLTLRLDAPQAVRAVVVDALGREVAVLLRGAAAGAVTLTVDAGRLAPGVYTVRVAGASWQTARRIVVAR